MVNITNRNLDYSEPIEIGDGIYWVGFCDEQSGLHCNPYIIIDNDEAILIDGGSRPDFPQVMMKILKTGINPHKIKALIYQHFDPDLCGSIPNLENIIDNDDLHIISDQANIAFIKHYYVRSEMIAINDINFEFKFSSGRVIKFYKTPYAHSVGSFVTYDSKSGIVFSSDLFGSYGKEWDLFLTLEDECASCNDYSNCPNKKEYCPIPDIIDFHRKVMPSERILKLAIEEIAKIPFTLIAPQHGSVIHKVEDIIFICEKLAELKGVGIDGISDLQLSSETDNIEALKKRLLKK